MTSLLLFGSFSILCFTGHSPFPSQAFDPGSNASSSRMTFQFFHMPSWNGLILFVIMGRHDVNLSLEDLVKSGPFSGPQDGISNTVLVSISDPGFTQLVFVHFYTFPGQSTPVG